MTRTLLVTCLSTTALIGWTAPAFAQETPPSDPAPPAEVAPAEEPIGFGEVVVTAQKREQRLQDVPAAVSAISAATLQAKGITETSDLMGTVPSLQVTTPYGRTQPNFALRGISVANEFSASTASPVGVYVDEVYQSFRASHGLQLYDIDRVEVLRGPQGTLYGRNTTGGAISFFTRQPKLGDADGYVTAGYANYDTFTLQGAAEATLVPDVLGIRFAGTFAKGDGWQRNVLPGLERDLGTTNTIGGRVAIRLRPSSALDINLKAYVGNDNPWGTAPYAGGQLAGAQDALGYSRFDPQAFLGGRRLDRNEVAVDRIGRNQSKTNGVGLNIKWEATDALTITSITGYDTGKYLNNPDDCDGGPADLCSIGFTSKSKNFNQDLRFSYSKGPLNVIAGLYYGKDTVKTVNYPDFFGVLRPLLLGAGLPGSFNNAAIGTPDAIRVLPAFALDQTLTPGTPGFCAPVVVNPNGFLDARSLVALQTDIAINNTGNGGAGGAYSAGCAAAGALPISPIKGEQRYDVTRPSKAIYGDVTWDATDKLTIALGARYTWDKVNYLNGSTNLYALDGVTPVINLIPYANPYNANLTPLERREKANRLTGRANISYKFTDDVMGYLQYSRGYRSGSFNGLAYQGVNQVYYIQPEKVNAYEGGLKTTFANRSLMLNLAGFYYDYANHQVTQVVGATTFTRSANGRLFGGEVEMNWRAMQGLRFDASFGYINSKYTGNAMDPADPSSPTLNVNGNPFPNAPKFTFQAGFDLDIINDGANKLKLRGDAAYMGKYYFDPFKNYGQSPCDAPTAGSNITLAGPDISCGNPSYWLVNGRLTYERGNFAVSAWAKNLLNKYYYTYGLNINVFGVDYLNRGMPRTYGLEATMKF